ncbi:hypothetical protein KC19_12G183300 [Ceratodon purpureus]|uniref:DSBA-like thioredoxin domain-containing protein n=1 Tax=Ceratodon purpureus TaxID=3225 RepID=A0A8T0G978_CERPU|nr:hypothetical protein KC19_12G183300 [Ceratodon purpureus]
MATNKVMIRVDVTSDTICPWCFIGKKHLEQAIANTTDKYSVEVRWHPFFLNPDAPVEGVNKMEHYKAKFGAGRMQMILDRVGGAFAQLGYKYSMGGKTGSTLDSHRLIEFAGRQSLAKQNALVEELFLNFFTQEKYIGDREVLVAAADKVGVDGARAFLEDPQAGLKEVLTSERQFHRGVSGVPHFVIDGRYQISGAQPPEAFLKAFDAAAESQQAAAAAAPTGACTRDGCQ